MISNKNLLLMTDVYKIGHLRMYRPGTTKIYSYLCARSTKKEQQALFFGLQPYLKLLEKGVTQNDVDEFYGYYKEVLGQEVPADITEKMQALVNLGFLPLEIKAVPEGTLIDNKNVLVTVTNTVDGFHWLVGFFESLLLKVWNTISVATLSNKFRRLVVERTAKTSDSDFLIPFLIHDFGYRGVSSEQTAELSGAAHLVNFCGTDTIPAIVFLKNNYSATGLIGASVPASEHSIHCSFGPTEQDELDYVNNMIDLNPTGIVSVVSDAYDYFRMLTVTLPKVKDKILARDGKYVVRPDSGNPIDILCGNARRVQNLLPAFKYSKETKGLPIQEVVECNGKFYMFDVGKDAPIEVEPTPEQKGTFRILEEEFGATINSKGFKELNPKIGVIYGDGMYYDRYKQILDRMEEMGYANTNLVIGVGGLLLQQHNRDDLGFAFKATYAEINGVATELYKDPKTDTGKKSHKGLMTLRTCEDTGKFITVDECTWDDEAEGHLQTVFKDGKLVKETTLEEIRQRVNNGN